MSASTHKSNVVKNHVAHGRGLYVNAYFIGDKIAQGQELLPTNKMIKTQTAKENKKHVQRRRSVFTSEEVTPSSLNDHAQTESEGHTRGRHQKRKDHGGIQQGNLPA